MSERKVGWSAEAILLGSGMFGNIAMSTLSPALPKIELSFGGAEADYLTKMVVSATGLGVIVVSPFTGTLVRRFGRRPVVIGAYTAFLLFGLVGMILPSLPLIIASRFVTGGAAAVVVAMGLILIGDFYQGRPRERRIGASHAIGALLVAGIIPIAGYLADISWRLAFLVHVAALPMLIIAIGSREIGGVHEVAPLAPGAKRTRIPPAVWLIMLLTLMAGGIGYSVQIFMPFHLRGIGAQSAGLAGTMLGICVLFSVLTSFLYAEVRRFASVAAVFALVMFGWSIGLAVTALTTTVTGTLIGMIVIGLAGGLVGPNIFSAVSALTTDSARAHSVGMTKGVYYFGPFFGPTVLQLLSLQTHADQALIALAAFAAGFGVLCAITALIVRSRRPAVAGPQLDAAFEAELEADRA